MKVSFKQSLVALSAVVALGAMALQPAHAQDKAQTIKVADAEGGGIVVSAVGEIVAVDAANRIVSIKGPKGNISDMLVDERVRNLDKVKVGDRVKLTYRVGVALALLKGGDGIREKVESEGAARAAEGAKPGGVLVKSTTVVANVEAVNQKRKIVTLKGPEGKVVDVQVKDPQVLKDVKVGDQVAAKITESVAVRVTPAKAKAQ
ncbi:hypothetical protein [Variovorax soli]|uniref:hypothetical protein n=1 Tax=Variovorax soli TaxID=376815 RepID=UPI000838D252|nr:hypothetical protein [Variovorax soli]